MMLIKLALTLILLGLAGLMVDKYVYALKDKIKLVVGWTFVVAIGIIFLKIIFLVWGIPL